MPTAKGAQRGSSTHDCVEARLVAVTWQSLVETRCTTSAAVIPATHCEHSLFRVMHMRPIDENAIEGRPAPEYARALSTRPEARSCFAFRRTPATEAPAESKPRSKNAHAFAFAMHEVGMDAPR